MVNALTSGRVTQRTGFRRLPFFLSFTLLSYAQYKQWKLRMFNMDCIDDVSSTS